MSQIGPWHLVDPSGAIGPLVANDWTDLTDGSLAHAIDRTEAGRVVAAAATLCSTNAPVHTGTAPDGSFDQAAEPNPDDPKYDCNDWKGASAVDQRLVGDARSVGSGWTQVTACLNSGILRIELCAPLLFRAVTPPGAADIRSLFCTKDST